MNQELELLDQIIEMALKKAEQLNAFRIANHQALETIGEDTVVFHLKALRELMTKDSLVGVPLVNLNHRAYQVATASGNQVRDIPHGHGVPFGHERKFVAP